MSWHVGRVFVQTGWRTIRRAAHFFFSIRSKGPCPRDCAHASIDPISIGAAEPGSGRRLRKGLAAVSITVRVERLIGKMATDRPPVDVPGSFAGRPPTR